MRAAAARMLAADAGTSIAAEGGVDRRTVFPALRPPRGPPRRPLRSSPAGEHAVQDAQLSEAPAAVALHRYVDIITVNRT
ncbi:hypothetical protein [Streptomyces sp. NPDC088400]|uniref:hypothetical protein n=1 Tax=Streptomyces sp. NPDC088400 TaxID=3365861 RepID=UPI00381D9B10